MTPPPAAEATHGVCVAAREVVVERHGPLHPRLAASKLQDDGPGRLVEEQPLEGRRPGEAIRIRRAERARRAIAGEAGRQGGTADAGGFRRVHIAVTALRIPPSNWFSTWTQALQARERARPLHSLAGRQAASWR